jgi:uncharacterized protein Yka (UPF0111/DUF47 family)
MFSKEKKVVDLVIAQAEKALQCVKHAGMALRCWLDGNLFEASEAALMADALEVEAGYQLDRILGRLCQGGGVAPIRENLFALAGGFQRLAAAATAASLFFVDRRPEIPQPYRPAFSRLVEIVLDEAAELNTAALNCLKGRWVPDIACEASRHFGATAKEIKKLRQDLHRRMTETDPAAGGRPTALDACLVEITRVFDCMGATADTVTRINLKFGN